MQKFYDEHYKELITDCDIVVANKLNYILDYEYTDIIKNIGNNIRANFANYVRKFVNIYFDIDNQTNDSTKSKDEISAIKNKYYKVKTDLLSKPDTEFISDEIFHQFIKQTREHIIPKESIFYKLSEKESGEDYKRHLEAKESIFHSGCADCVPLRDAVDENSIAYDVHTNTLHYIYPMIYLNRQIQLCNDKIILAHKDKTDNPPIYKLFHVLPLRTSLVPSYVTFDTAALINCFIKENQMYYLQNYSKKNLYAEIWERFFNLNQKVFHKKGYRFNYMIKTDGFACSI